MFWLPMAFLSALFAGITAILAKCGIRSTDSDVATALRTGVVLIFSWLMVLAAGSAGTISSLTVLSLVFLVLSGLSTGASWLCYYAIQNGAVSVVVSVDKLSLVVTVLFSRLVLKERLEKASLVGLGLMVLGTLVITFCG